jgi:hypothetical protein
MTYASKGWIGVAEYRQCTIFSIHSQVRPRHGMVTAIVSSPFSTQGDKLRLPSDGRGACPKEGAMISYYDAERDKVSTSH